MPELIVVMTMTLMFTGLLLSFMFDMWGQAGSLQSSSDTLVERQNLGDKLRNSLNEATLLLNQNSIADDNVLVPEPADATGTAWQILHAVPEKIAMPPSGEYKPIFYYEAPATDASDNYIMRGVSPYQNDFILYLDGTNKALKKRNLANPDAPGNSLRSTCSSAAVSASCSGDETLADNVSSVSLKFFSKSGNSLNRNDVLDPETGEPIGPDYGDVEVVELTVSFEKRAIIKGTAKSESQTTVRVALRNG